MSDLSAGNHYGVRILSLNGGEPGNVYDQCPF